MSGVKAFAISILAMGLLPACASNLMKPTSHVDQHWGEAVQLNAAAMIANPETSSVAPEGLDPLTAERVAERYYRGQQQQPLRKIPAIVIAE